MGHGQDEAYELDNTPVTNFVAQRHSWEVDNWLAGQYITSYVWNPKA
jgi:hypothetical protein